MSWALAEPPPRTIPTTITMIFINVLGYISLSNYTISTAEEILKKELSKIYSTLLDEENPTQLMLSLGKLKSINIYFSEIFLLQNH